MNRLIKILHVDASWKVLYILIRHGVLVKTAVSLKTALELLKKHKFDLIFSEPQSVAILDPQAPVDERTMCKLPFWNKFKKYHLMSSPSGVNFHHSF
jgi:hypothetical protein